MKHFLRGFAAAILLIALAVYLNNASWLAPRPEGERYFVSHRGVHHTYHHAGLENDTCTAERIYPLRHSYLENTLPSIEAGFAAGAEIVEIDIHPTTDGEFAVWHDWTLDCRTEGTGVTRQRSMAYIRTLDAGYGYTADGGETYPLRGTGVGAIPTLGEVLDAFPGRRLVINFKSNDPAEADLLTDYLRARDADLSLISVYGGHSPTHRFIARNPGVRGYSKPSLKACLAPYVALGWSGHVPAACRDTIIAVPQNYAWLMWGWPRRFQQRMTDAGTDIWMLGDWGDETSSGRIDTREEVEALPDEFAGGIWTNRIEVVAAE